MNRLKEIETRLGAIKKELDNENADIDALEKEVNELKEERQSILDKIEKRKNLVNSIVTGESADVIKTFEDEEERKGDEKMKFTKENVLASKEYRSAWAKTLMKKSLNEVEKRALGTALTTTDETYVAATAEADGVNNGGLFIPEDVMMELMNRIELASPFFRDIPKTEVNGYIKFPYRKSGTGADAQTEGTDNSDGQVEWGELTLTVLEVSETIRVTWKLEAMSVDSFIDYILDELSMALPEKIMTQMFYGDGSGTLTGIASTGNFIDGEYTIGEGAGEVFDLYEAISAGIDLMTDKRKKVGAKIYVADDIMHDMTFARDSEGRFMYSPINGVGIKSLGKYTIEVDPFLNDGDFVIGNPRYYRFNWNEGISITKDVSGKSRINDYTGYAVVSGAPQPASFVYGKKSS